MKIDDNKRLQHKLREVASEFIANTFFEYLNMRLESFGCYFTPERMKDYEKDVALIESLNGYMLNEEQKIVLTLLCMDLDSKDYEYDMKVLKERPIKEFINEPVKIPTLEELEGPFHSYENGKLQFYQEWNNREHARKILGELMTVLQNARMINSNDDKLLHFNPYLKAILEAYQSDNVMLCPGSLEILNTCDIECFKYDESYFKNGMRIPKIAVAKNRIYFPARRATEGMYNYVPFPNINIREENAAKEATGKTLVLFGGIGNLAYLASQNPEVTSVTIVTRTMTDEEMLRDHLIPLMKSDKSIDVICANPDTFIETVEDGEYDSILSSALSEVQSITRYVMTKRQMLRFKKTKTIIVGENEMILDDVFRHFQYLVLCDMNVIYPEDDPVLNGWINLLDILLENEEIRTPEHYDWYAVPRNLLNTIIQNL